MKRLLCRSFGLQFAGPGVDDGISVEIVDLGHDSIQTSKPTLTYYILRTNGNSPQQSEYKESMYEATYS